MVSMNLEKNDIDINTTNEKTNKNSREIFFAKFNKSCLITYVGILFGVLAMYFSFTRVAFVDGCFVKYSFLCLILSGICDMFDGKFARACKRTEEEKEFGIQLDSLADTFCFIATPIVIMLAIGLTKVYHIISYALFAICGISRLGYFNTKADADNAVKSYSGLPVTSTAIVYPFIGILHMFLPLNVLSIIYCVATFLTGMLFVLNIKVPKFKGIAYVVIPILALIWVVILWVR